MKEADNSADTCAVCGGVVTGDRVCHLYQKGECVTLCGPACVQDFLIATHDQSGPHPLGGLIQEMVEETRW